MYLTGTVNTWKVVTTHACYALFKVSTNQTVGFFIMYDTVALAPPLLYVY